MPKEVRLIKGATFKPSDKYKCPRCGYSYGFGGYVAAHWDEVLGWSCPNCKSYKAIIQSGEVISAGPVGKPRRRKALSKCIAHSLATNFSKR